jgi:hypothetical protein
MNRDMRVDLNVTAQHTKGSDTASVCPLAEYNASDAGLRGGMLIAIAVAWQHRAESRCTSQLRHGAGLGAEVLVCLFEGHDFAVTTLLSVGLKLAASTTTFKSTIQ